MQTSNYKSYFTKYLTFAASIVAVVVLASSCSKDKETVTPSGMNDLRTNDLKTINAGSANSGTNMVELIAGQSINAGNITMNDIDDNNDGIPDRINVTYTTTNGWELLEIHFWIGNSLSEMPATKSGNPKIGNFPYNYSNLTGLTTYSFDVDINTLTQNFNCLNENSYFVAAHASVRLPNGSGGYQTETGWGDGSRLTERGSWSMFYQIWITCEGSGPPPVSYDSETAFAYGDSYASCFQNFPQYLDNPKRWGWTNGPLSPDTYYFEIYAGAGLCDLTKGTMVGTLTVTYDGSFANVSYDLDEPYRLSETHLYVGNAEFATNNQGEFTLAPGQYDYVTEFDNTSTLSHSITNIPVTGNIYVVAHAAVLIPSN